MVYLSEFIRESLNINGTYIVSRKNETNIMPQVLLKASAMVTSFTKWDESAKSQEQEVKTISLVTLL